MEEGWVGRTFKDRYEILELLGTGGMSSVYKAKDPNLDRIVAVKIIHPHLTLNDDFLRRFRAEATSVAQLRHPNIVQVFDFDTTDDTAYIVFEFVPGENLQERLTRMNEAGRVMEAEEAIRISTQVGNALDYAHGRGLVHRDIKPANVMLDLHGDAFLADFGIVKITDDVQHTATGAVVGTARYMSPEQIRGAPLDGRSDLYSLGVTMFEMASGQPPFKAESAMTLMMMHVNDPIPDMDAAGIPVALGSVIGRMLAKNPDDRFASAGEMVEALAASSAPAPPEGQADSQANHAPTTIAFGEGPAIEPVPSSPPSGRGRTLAVIGAAIVVAVLVVGVIVAVSSGGSDSSDPSASTDVAGNGVAAGAQVTETGAGAPAEAVAITDIGVANGRYVVDYETFGYTEQLPGQHVHFYWNDIFEFEAGMGPYQADWYVWGGPRPFDGYLVADRPDDATEMCAVVANPDHTIETGTGNCMALP